MSTEGLTYTYDELVSKSAEIKHFANNRMATELEDIRDTNDALKSNYKSEQAEKVTAAIAKVQEDGEEFKEAILKFADAIENEIAPTYAKVEETLREATDSTQYYT